jgi:hypothetical protein
MNMKKRYQIEIETGLDFNEDYFKDRISQLCTSFGDTDAKVEGYDCSYLNLISALQGQTTEKR